MVLGRSAFGCFLLALSVLTGGATAAERRPDLEGVWSYAWITSLERPAAFTALELTEAQAKAFEAGHTGVPEPATGGPVGQDTSEWWDMGGKVGRIAGQPRSSWIVDPANGKLPYSPAGLAALAASRAAAQKPDNPETRPAPERCLMGLGGTSLPPMLNASYNGQLRIVQTPGAVVVLTEMNAGPRIIPLGDGRHEPGGAWNGHSVGHWEGATLVVETTGFHRGTEWRTPSPLYVSAAGKVTERFTKVGPDEIRYAYVVDDPATFTQVWRGETPLRRSRQPMFEFACHEGNYSLSGILGGARQQEREAARGRSPGSN
jgi:hypothetical protein